jgi:hypothetical protein
MRITVLATRPSLSARCPDSHTRTASPAAPTKLVVHTTTQLRSTWRVVTHPSAHAIASRLLPVKSSAPATVTSTSPSEKLRPPSSRVAAKPRPASLATSVNISAPSPMKAPASTPSIARGSSGSFALTTQNSFTRPAISLGE